MIPHFFTEEAAMKLSFAVLLAVANWRGVRMDGGKSRSFASSSHNSRRRNQQHKPELGKPMRRFDRKIKT